MIPSLVIKVIWLSNYRSFLSQCIKLSIILIGFLESELLKNSFLKGEVVWALRNVEFRVELKNHDTY